MARRRRKKWAPALRKWTTRLLSPQECEGILTWYKDHDNLLSEWEKEFLASFEEKGFDRITLRQQNIFRRLGGKRREYLVELAKQERIERQAASAN
jgi:hypothetical protein